MKRILSFIFIFILVAAGLLGSIVWYGWDAFETLFINRAGMAEGSEWIEQTYSTSGLNQFIGEHNDFSSLSRIEVNSADLHSSQSDLNLNQHEPRAVGLVGSIYLMGTYAEAFSTGELNPDEKIPFDDLSAWQLPSVYAQAHESLKELAQEKFPDLKIPLKTLVGWLPVASDIALYDYLLARLNPESIQSLFDRAQLQQTERPVPFSGLYITSSEWFDGTLALFSEQDLIQWKNKVAKNPERMKTQEFRNWIHDYAWNRAKTHHSNQALSNDWRQRVKKDHLGLTFMQERDALAFFPATSTADLVRFTEALFQKDIVSESAQKQLKEWLGWAGIESEHNSDPGIQILQTGSIYDSRIGLLSGLHLVRFKQTENGEEKWIFMAGVLDQLPVGLWFHLSANHMHQDYFQKLTIDTTWIAQSERMIQSIDHDSTHP